MRCVNSALHPSIRATLAPAFGWFTYLKLRPEDMSWRIVLSHVSGDVPFEAVAAAARREGAQVIEYSENFTAWDEHGVQIDIEWPKPCYWVYGEPAEWVAPHMLVIEGVGVGALGLVLVVGVVVMDLLALRHTAATRRDLSCES